MDLDCEGGHAWRRFLTARSLFEAWSAPQPSPWSAYAKPTLFAALPPRTDRVFPVRASGVPATPPPRAPRLGPGTGVVLDLPGPTAVAYAAWLARDAGFQPVPLFNNWPHGAGVVRAEDVLGALLHYVPWVAAGRAERGTAAPPAFVLDRDRLGARAPRPNDFDNRYFHTEADLPSGATLRRHGIERLLYVGPGVPPPAPATVGEAGALGALVGERRVWGSGPEMDDLNAYLHAARKTVGLESSHAVAGAWDLGTPQEFAPALRKTPFNTTKDPAFLGFRRSSAGGFGRFVPEPQSGGGGFG
jgi:hypothetical protein